jgi:hypothetical protein
VSEPYNRFTGQSLEHLTALSDGLFAVAMTLLVLVSLLPFSAALLAHYVHLRLPHQHRGQRDRPRRGPAVLHRVPPAATHRQQAAKRMNRAARRPAPAALAR